MARSAARSPSTPDPRLALALRRLVLLGLLLSVGTPSSSPTTRPPSHTGAPPQRGTTRPTPT